jgi:conjugative transposon TraJ protein
MALLFAGVGMLCPALAMAQDVPVTGASSWIHGLQSILEQVYNTMMVNVGELTAIGQGLAGFGALLYVCYRAWGHLARAEAIDFYPMLRPFAIGLVLAFYPGFIGLLNGILQPTVTGTAALVDNSNQAITTLLQQQQAMIQQGNEWQMYVGPEGQGSEEKWEQYSGDADSGLFSGIANDLKFMLSKLSFSIDNWVRKIMSEILQVVYEAAALCINTLRTFELVLLGILGPLAIGLSAFDGFKSIFVAWLARYVNVFLWLPVANVFGSLCGQIQAAMIQMDNQQLAATGQTSFSETDTAYLIFLIIATIGYFCVPSITNHIINVFPSGGGSLLQRVSSGPAGFTTGPGSGAKDGGLGGFL